MTLYVVLPLLLFLTCMCHTVPSHSVGFSPTKCESTDLFVVHSRELGLTTMDDTNTHLLLLYSARDFVFIDNGEKTWYKELAGKKSVVSLWSSSSLVSTYLDIDPVGAALYEEGKSVCLFYEEESGKSTSKTFLTCQKCSWVTEMPPTYSQSESHTPSFQEMINFPPNLWAFSN